jgi:hypothetical protein
MGERFKTDGINNNSGPGPGTYNLDEKPHMFGTKISTDTNKRLMDNIVTFPGPGAYNIESKSTLGTKIGKGCRDDLNQSYTPGPGEYE